MTHADCIKMLLPVLMETMTAFLRHPGSRHARAARDSLLGAVEDAVTSIVTAYKRLGTGEPSHNGEFLANMDRVFALIDGPGDSLDVEELDEVTRWILRHSVTVAKSSGAEDEAEITRACQKTLMEVNKVKRSLGPASGQLSSGQAGAGLAGLGAVLELLEQSVNSALLRLAISALPGPGRPLDTLLASVLGSELEAAARAAGDLAAAVQLLDRQTERVLQLCHFCIFCTTDGEKAQRIRSLGRLLETLEADLVPAVLQLYYNPEDEGARSFVKVVRRTWKCVLEDLSSVVRSIVDPTAYCVILLQEMTAAARRLKEGLYTQEAASLAAEVGSLLAMAESGVDLAWRECGEQSPGPGGLQPLPDSHPLVTAERSIWEVRAASRLVTASIADLSLHQSLHKRTHVLLAAFEAVVQLLTEKQEDTADPGSSRILGSLVEEATEAAAPTPRQQRPQSSQCLSFRAVRSLDRTAALAGELRREPGQLGDPRELYRITADLTPFTPDRRPAAALQRKPSSVTVNGCILHTPIRRSEVSSGISSSSDASFSGVYTGPICQKAFRIYIGGMN